MGDVAKVDHKCSQSRPAIKTGLERWFPGEISNAGITPIADK